MRSREEDDVTCNKLPGVIYVLLHCSLSVPGPDKGFEGQLEHSSAQPARARRWAGAVWRTRSAPASTGVCGILAHPRCAVRINGTSHLKEGFRVESKGSLDRMLRASRQMMNIQQGQANPILYVLPQEITPFLPAMLGSPACIRQF